MLRAFGHRLLETGIETAFYSFWGAVIGAFLSAVLFVVLTLRDAAEKWQYALGGAFLAFLLVLLATAAVVWLKRKSKEPKKVGRKGLLNYVIDRDRALAATTESLEAIGRETVKMGKEIGRGRIDVMVKKGGKNLPEKVYKRSAKIARKISKRAGIMEIHAQRLKQNVELLDESLRNWLDWLARSNTTPTDTPTLLSSLASFRHAAATGALPATVGFRESVSGTCGLSDTLDLAGERLMAVLDSMIASIERVIRICDDTKKRLGG